MMLEDFNTVYPDAATIFMENNFDISTVYDMYGQRDDWSFIKSMLLGAEAIPPNSIPG